MSFLYEKIEGGAVVMPIERVAKVHETKEKQHLILDNRETLNISGANDVIAFSDNAIELDTNMGMLLIKGESLRIISISTEGKSAEICGRINALEYKKPRENKSILKSIFK